MIYLASVLAVVYGVVLACAYASTSTNALTMLKSVGVAVPWATGALMDGCEIASELWTTEYAVSC